MRHSQDECVTVEFRTVDQPTGKPLNGVALRVRAEGNDVARLTSDEALGRDCADGTRAREARSVIASKPGFATVKVILAKSSPQPQHPPSNYKPVMSAGYRIGKSGTYEAYLLKE